MINDFVVIQRKFPRALRCIRIYPLFDLHIGAKECNMKLALRWRERVLNDPEGYVILGGDLINNGVKDSKTNVYEETMMPRAQEDTLCEFLKPLVNADKILGWHDGNHEYRSAKAVDHCPGYTCACRLGIEHLYRQNACFYKISLGAAKKDRQITYAIVSTHGASRNKHDKFTHCVENADVYVSGHTHTEEISTVSVLRMDLYSGTVKPRAIKRCIVSSFLDYGGYAMRAEHAPQVREDIQVIVLNGQKKHVLIQNI